jgi:hypothetical protein
MKKLLLLVIIPLLMIWILPVRSQDTLYVDDSDGSPAYLDGGGPWTTSSIGFRSTSRAMAGIPSLPSGQWARWTPEIFQSGYYAAYFILPSNISSGRDNTLYTVTSLIGTDSLRFHQNENAGNWRFIGIYFLEAGLDNSIECINDDSTTAGYWFYADAVRFILSGDERKIDPLQRNTYDYGEVPMGAPEDWILRVYNIGGSDLTIHGVTTQTGIFSIIEPAFPVVVGARSHVDVIVRFNPNFERLFEDTITIVSDDPIEPSIEVPVQGTGTTMTGVVNNDDGFPYYMEHLGVWQNSDSHANFVGIDNPSSRYSILSDNLGARAQFVPNIPISGLYNIYVAGPATSNASNHALYEVHPFGGRIDSVYLNQNTSSGSDWKYVGTYFLFEGDLNSIFVVNDGTGTGYVLRADLVKFTMVPQVADIALTITSHAFGETSIDSTALFTLPVHNLGNLDLSILSMTFNSPNFNVEYPTSNDFPVTIPPLDSLLAIVSFSPQEIMSYGDTLTIISDDIDEPTSTVELSGEGIGIQIIVDNSDSLYCTIGPTDTSWNYSASSAGINSNSLYTYLLYNPDAWIKWIPNVVVGGNYDLYVSCIPTSNASANALYIVQPIGVAPDSFYIDQNSTSAADIWIKLGTFYFGQGELNWITLVNDTSKTNLDANGQRTTVEDSLVLRADAIKLSEPGKFSPVTTTCPATSPAKYRLYQNYPNPFNPQTRIRFNVPRDSEVSITIYNTLGQKVTTLVDKLFITGIHEIVWDGKDKVGRISASGVYFVKMKAGGFYGVKKILLMR